MASSAAVLFVLLACVWSCLGQQRPNFVIMMADDLGYGDLSSYGNTSLPSPNLDRLASEGVKLTHALAASATCTPSRAAFLTGRYPERSGMAPSGVLPVIIHVAQPSGLPTSEITFATALRNAGYKTALIGKWHQGLHCNIVGDKCHHPHSHGFDYFYGLPLSNNAEYAGDTRAPVDKITRSGFFTYVGSTVAVSLVTCLWLFRKGHRLLGALLGLVGVILPVYLVTPLYITKRLNSILMKDDVVIEQPIHLPSLTRRFAREAVKFIEDQDGTQKPFLLLLSFTHVHVALETQARFRGRSKHGAFGDAVMEMDWAVGEVLEALDRRGIRNDTFVLFTSDHGAHLEEAEDEAQGGNNGILSGGKGMYGMEGGIRVPLVVSMPGRIPPGVVSAPVSLMDVFPTVANLAQAHVSPDRVLDGRDMGPLLFGPRPALSRHRALFHTCRVKDIHAVTLVHNESIVWKVHLVQPAWLPGTRRCQFICRCQDSNLQYLDESLIYNIAQDPSECHPMPSSDPQYQVILDEVKQEISKHMATLEEVPTQITPWGLLWRPWLQPWCSFPFSSCREETQG